MKIKMRPPERQLNSETRFAQGAAVLLTVLLAGCSSKIKNVPPPIPMPEQFSESGKTPLPEKWWESFNDPSLNALIEEAMGNNFTIRSAWDRLSQAEQVAVQAGAALLPDVTRRMPPAPGRRSPTRPLIRPAIHSVWSPHTSLTCGAVCVPPGRRPCWMPRPRRKMSPPRP